MAHLTADRVKETTTTTGTGAITLAGAIVGFRAFSSVLSIGDTCYYSIASLPGAEWEVGIGTYSALNTLTRTTVLSSSNAGAAVTFSAGTKEIFITAAASRFLQADNTGVVNTPFPLGISGTGYNIAIAADSGGSLSLGRKDNVASSPYIDFNSGATTVDYDIRLTASGGTGVAGNGTLFLTGNFNPTTTTTYSLGSSSLVWATNYSNKFISSNSSAQSLTDGAAVFNGAAGAILIDDGGHKRISWNDAGGNFNIRAGNYYNATSAAVVYAKGVGDTNSGAATITLVSDSSDGSISMSVASIGVPGATVAYSKTLTLATTGMSYDGNVTATTFIGALTGNASGSAATFTSTTQNSQFNSIGIGVAASNTAGQLNAGSIIASGYVSAVGTGGSGQLQAVSGSASTWYNAFLRNDGGDVRLMSSAVQTTQANATNATWNAYRPFSWSLTTGAVTIDGTGIGTTVGGALTAVGGIKSSDTVQPSYQILLDFGADLTGTWRKIITATLSAGTQYSTHGFKIKITDPNANHATQGSVNVDEVVYYVACVRSESTVLDTPDLCVVRGPAQHVRAVKTATGSYEIQVQPEGQYREYLITIESYATNGGHTIVYSNGSTTGSAGTATYSAAVGGATTWVDKLQSTGTITGTQLVSNIATGTAPLAVTSTTLVTNLNADLLDGLQSATANTVSTIVARDASGNFSAGTITAALSGNASTATSVGSLTGIATVAPLAAGTAAVGTSTLGARQDHVHPLQTTISGNAGTATTLADDSTWMKSRGTVTTANQDTAVLNGYYLQSNTSDSQGILAFNSGGSLGPLQMTFTYGGLFQFRNKTDQTTWTAWKTVLTSLNYNSYSPTLTGTGASGTWGISISGNAATVTNGLTTGNYATYLNNTYLRATGTAPAFQSWATTGNVENTIYQINQENFNLGTGTGNSDFPTARTYSYGVLLNLSANASGRAQIYISHAGNDLIFRGGWGTASWQTWNRVLSDQNYNSYAPTLTGTGASGTWGINVTGSAGSASSATTAGLLYGGAGGYIASSAAASTSYANSIQVREIGLAGAQASAMAAAPRLSFHWSGLVASSIAMEASGRIGIFNNPGTSYEALVCAGFQATTGSFSSTVTASSFSGAGTGLTGTATSLSIGGNAATVTNGLTTGNYSSYALPLSGGTLTGDITTYRSGSPTTGVIYFGNSGSRYLYYDGTNYAMPNGQLDVGSNRVLTAGNYSSYALPLSGGSVSGNILFTNGRKGLIGQYDAAQTQAIFAMGSSYILTDGGASTVYGNFYGLAWSYNPDYGAAGNNPQSKAGLNHQLLLMQAGVTTAAIGTGVWTSGVVTGSSFTGAGTGLTGTAASLSIGGNAATVGSLSVHSARNNEANKVVRTDGSGYIQAGWINTTSGDNGTAAIDRVYASGDGYIRYYTPANFRTVLDVPTRTGGSASGTWAIAISGNAATATTSTNSNAVNSTGYGSTNFTWRQESGTFAGQTGWASYLISSHGDGSTYYNHTLIMPFWGPPQYSRLEGGTFKGPYTILSTENYNSYSPTLTGGGASGSWGISVTGSSASCTGVSARATRANGNFYIDDNYGNGVVGVYASTRYQGVFAMGDSYKLPADGTTTGSLYGLAWSYPGGQGGASGNLNNHGLLVLINGGFGCALSSSIVANLNITAYSDERLKTNWRNLPDNFVSRLAKVKHGIYDRTDNDNLTQVGVSAQSLQELLPDAVTTATDDMKTLSVSYGNAAMASAVELAIEVVDLRERVAKLEQLINTLMKEQK